MLQQSWDETREKIAQHPRATAWSAVALVLVVVAVSLGFSRNDDGDGSTKVRADQSAVSVVTPTTYFGNDVLPNPNAPKSTAGLHPNTGVTLRNGDGLHLYTGTIPNYGGGGPGATTTTPGGPEPTTPSGGGTTVTTAYPAAVFGANRIAYVTNGQTWTVNPDGSDPRFVANSAYFPAWAPSHSAIAVADGQSPGGILSYITAGGGRYALTPQPAANDGDSRPTWSPDGLRLAFGRITNGDPVGYSSIWVINKDGQNARRVSVAGCFTADPSWSPDGTHIAFWSSRDHCSNGDNIGSYELYLMNSDGTHVTRLATAVNSGAPAFSPDGTQIAFASDRDGDFDIYVMNTDGDGPQTPLTDSAGDESDPTWSPDGSRIAFSRNGTIYTMKANGSDVKPVIAGAQPSWS